jgi:hypothetical protein
MTDNENQLKRQQAREQREIARAHATGKSHTYIDDDGCEVTVTPSGHSFYNAADWW